MEADTTDKPNTPASGLHAPTCSPLRGKALIHRDQYPQHYMGANPQGFPCWTSYPLNAIAYDPAEVHDMLNWLVKWELSVKAVIYPASQVALPDWANA